MGEQQEKVGLKLNKNAAEQLPNPTAPCLACRTHDRVV